MMTGEHEPILRREVILPVTPSSWLWSCIVVKAVLIAGALVAMALIS